MRIPCAYPAKGALRRANISEANMRPISVWVLLALLSGCTNGAEPKQEAGNCNDETDNDADGFVDCGDQDCASDPSCSTNDSDIDTDADADTDSVSIVDADSDGVADDLDCDDNDPSSTTVATDADCDGTLTADDCDDANPVSLTRAQDGDCDGTITASDCDDLDPGSTVLAQDGDCDGVVTSADCDDGDSNSLTRAQDGDCDGTVTAADCDDGNPSSTVVASDADCDGIATIEDCDDNDATNAWLAGSAECDALARECFALDYDGIDDYLDLGEPTELEYLRSADFAIDFVFTLDALPNGAWAPVISRGDAVGHLQNAFIMAGVFDDGSMRFFLRSAGTSGGSPLSDARTPANVITPGVEHHVLVQRDFGTDLEVWVDGALAARENDVQGTIPFSAPRPLFVGSTQEASFPGTNSPSRYFDGLIDNVRIWNRVLTDTEAADLMPNEIPGGLAGSLVADFPFDEGSGTSVTDSANGLDGTISGASWTQLDPLECPEPPAEPPEPSCYSVDLDGVDDYIAFGDVAGMGSSATYEMWLNGSAPPTADPNYGGWLLQSTCGYVGWTTSGIYMARYPACDGTGSGFTAELTEVPVASYPTGWWHLAVTIDPSHVADVFIDGVWVGSQSLRSASWSGVYEGTLGATDAVGFDPNHFSDVSFAGVRLSRSVRYSSNFTPEFPLTTDGDTELLYTFEEGAGTSTMDQSASDNDATLVGGVWVEACPE